MKDLLNELKSINLPHIPVLNNGLIKSEVPTHGGVYCFWWMSEDHPLQSTPFLNPIPSKGPGNEVVFLPVDESYFLRMDNGAIPLYVGKTGGLSKRFSQHLMLGTKKTGSYIDEKTPLKRRNSSCQFRHGIDVLFREISDTRQFTLDNVGISWVDLDGTHNSYERCFFEHYAISHLKPYFNYDIER